MLAFLLVDRGGPTLSALALAIAALVKLAPLVALPFLLPALDVASAHRRARVLATGLALYWPRRARRYSGLAAYWGTWRNNELVFHYLERWTRQLRVARAIAAAPAGGVHRSSRGGGAAARAGTRVALRAGLLMSPVLHPWYLGWALVFEPLGPPGRGSCFRSPRS